MTILQGKKGLIIGVANNHSLAYGIASHCVKFGANIALTYQNESFEKRVKPLSEELQAHAFSCDYSIEGDLERALHGAHAALGGLDFIVHSIAYSDKNELTGRFVDTTQDNFLNTLNVSCYSFIEMARLAEPLLSQNSALLTLSYEGAVRVMNNYNVMGVAKAALESSVRYLAADLGPKNIRVNAISAGPMRTLAGAVIGGARTTYNWQGRHSPLHRNNSLEEIGGSAAYLLSDLSMGITGEIHYVDSGYHSVGMVTP